MKILITKSQYDRLLKPSEKMKERLKSMGAEDGAKFVGGYQNYINIMFDGNIENYFKELGLPPYYITKDGMNMYIHNTIVDLLNLRDTGFRLGNERPLGAFRWKSGGIDYRVNASLIPINREMLLNNSVLKQGQYWKVLGSSGDSGWGYTYISKRNIIGKRGRQQIFRQIIERYGLNS
jgi:hypothetical protein